MPSTGTSRPMSPAGSLSTSIPKTGALLMEASLGKSRARDDNMSYVTLWLMVMSHDSIRGCLCPVDRSVTLLSAGRDKTASGLCRVYKLVFVFHIP